MKAKIADIRSLLSQSRFTHSMLDFGASDSSDILAALRALWDKDVKLLIVYDKPLSNTVRAICRIIGLDKYTTASTVMFNSSPRRAVMMLNHTRVLGAIEPDYVVNISQRLDFHYDSICKSGYSITAKRDGKVLAFHYSASAPDADSSLMSFDLSKVKSGLVGIDDRLVELSYAARKFSEFDAFIRSIVSVVQRSGLVSRPRSRCAILVPHGTKKIFTPVYRRIEALLPPNATVDFCTLAASTYLRNGTYDLVMELSTGDLLKAPKLRTCLCKTSSESSTEMYAQYINLKLHGGLSYLTQEISALPVVQVEDSDIVSGLKPNLEVVSLKSGMSIERTIYDILSRVGIPKSSEDARVFVLFPRRTQLPYKQIMQSLVGRERAHGRLLYGTSISHNHSNVSFKAIVEIVKAPDSCRSSQYANQLARFNSESSVMQYGQYIEIRI